MICLGAVACSQLSFLLGVGRVVYKTWKKSPFLYSATHSVHVCMWGADKSGHCCLLTCICAYKGCHGEEQNCEKFGECRKEGTGFLSQETPRTLFLDPSSVSSLQCICKLFSVLPHFSFLLPQMLRGSVAPSRLSVSDFERGFSEKQGTPVVFLTEGGVVFLSQPHGD